MGNESGTRMARPFFSILIPTYNRAAFLRNCLESLLVQDLDGVEVIVGDNASTDETPQVVEAYARVVTRCVRHERNLGALANFEAIGKLASGRFVVLHQDDDYLAPGFLHVCRRLFERHPSATMFCSPIWEGSAEHGYRSQMPAYLLEALTPFATGGSSYMLAPGGIGAALFLFSFYANPPAVALSGDALAKGRGYACGAAGGGADIMAAVRVLQHGDLIYCPFTGSTRVLHADNFCERRSRPERREAIHTIIGEVLAEMRAGAAPWRENVRHVLGGMRFEERCRHYRRFLKNRAPADLLALVRKECRPQSLREAIAFALALGGKGLARHVQASR